MKLPVVILAALILSALTTPVGGTPAKLKCGIGTRKGLEFFENCVSGKDDTIQIDSKHFAQIMFDKYGLAGVFVGTDCYWINSKGLARKTHCFDNGADYFVEKLARYIGSNGKFGFINRKLEVIIPPRFDFAFPFSQGKAEYCNNCKASQKAGHENYSMVGGVWGKIDKKGNQIQDRK